jgi:hypothetical protein
VFVKAGGVAQGNNCSRLRFGGPAPEEACTAVVLWTEELPRGVMFLIPPFLVLSWSEWWWWSELYQFSRRIVDQHVVWVTPPCFSKRND